jgi:hypothetical protein
VSEKLNGVNSINAQILKEVTQIFHEVLLFLETYQGIITGQLPQDFMESNDKLAFYQSHLIFLNLSRKSPRNNTSTE